LPGKQYENNRLLSDREVILLIKRYITIAIRARQKISVADFFLTTNGVNGVVTN
jgi:hypothetical protein